MGGGGGSTVTEAGLPDWAQPYAQDAVQTAVGQYKAGEFGNVAGLTGQQQDAFNRKAELGQRGGVLDQLSNDSYAASQAYRDAASGSGLFGTDALGQQTQALEDTIGQAQRGQLAQLTGQSSLGGTLSSARNQAATNRALAQTAGDIASRELAARREYSLGGAQGVLGAGDVIAGQAGRGADVTEQVGSALQQQQQNQADAAYQGTQRLFGLLGSGVTGQKQVSSQKGKQHGNEMV